MDLVTIAILTGVVLTVLLTVLAVIAIIVLAPAVRRAMAQRSGSEPREPDSGDHG
ncbi:hypothetical protein [Microcella sp.]|uniref:hypothetical protein n=1 Tax=Microcella sp. TaxID=1913979 RepID=UPI003F6FD568